MRCGVVGGLGEGLRESMNPACCERKAAEVLRGNHLVQRPGGSGETPRRAVDPTRTRRSSGPPVVLRASISLMRAQWAYQGPSPLWSLMTFEFCSCWSF